MIYNTTSVIKEVHGGRTKSLLKRCLILEKNLGVKNTIVTTNYNPNYPSVIQSLISKGKVSTKTKFVNIYDWASSFNLFNYRKTFFTRKLIQGTSEIDTSNYHSCEDNEKNIQRFYDKDDTYRLYRRFNKKTGNILFEDIMIPTCKKKVKRIEYNSLGHKHRVIEFSDKTFYKVKESYYDLKGRCYLIKNFSKEKENELVSIFLIYKGNSFLFNREKDFFTFFFTHFFKDGDVVFNDARLLDRSLLSCNIKTKNNLVFHSSHMDGDKIRSSFKLAFNWHEKVANYIVLTSHQKQDILTFYPTIQQEKIKVIPHSILPTEPSFHERNDFCFVGRISKEKRIDHILKAFALFKENGGVESLNIYGENIDHHQEELEALCEELSLTDSVHFKGYTANVSDIFSHSRCSFLTSNFEGFGMSVMESINLGCPVISYDIKYGPNELIDNRKNGILVEAGNITELSEAMFEISSIDYEKVSLNPVFYEDAFVANFDALLKTLNK